MTCNLIGSAIVCTIDMSKFHKVELTTGEVFWFEHHNYSGAIIWKDEDTTEEWDCWWDNDNIHDYVTNWYEINKGNLR